MIWNVKRRTGMHTHAQITFTDLLDSAAAAATFALCSYRNFIRSHVYRLHLPEHVQISVRRSFYSLHIHYNDMLIQGAQNKNKESRKKAWNSTALESIVLLIEKKISFQYIFTMLIQRIQNDLLFHRFFIIKRRRKLYIIIERNHKIFGAVSFVWSHLSMLLALHDSLHFEWWDKGIFHTIC